MHKNWRGMATSALPLWSPERACPACNATGGGVLPSLLLIGTRKGGTTALSTHIAQHPRVQMPDCKSGRDEWPAFARTSMCVWDKEVRFFSRGNSLSICWYRSLYPCGGGDVRVAFDASPDYLVLPDAKIEAMALTLGARARLVALLRDPTDRFYSAYNMGMNERLARLAGRNALGADPGARVTYANFAASLDRLLECAPRGCPSEPTVVSMFFNYGMYATHLRRFFARFGREAVLVEASEDFYDDPWPTVRRVLSHAGIEATREYVQSVRRSALTDKGRNQGGVWGGKLYRGRLLPPERLKLGRYYAPHNRELYALLGRELGWADGNGTRSGAARSASPVEEFGAEWVAGERRPELRHELRRR